jgi:NADH-quinone oxidoreductase subunit F
MEVLRLSNDVVTSKQPSEVTDIVKASGLRGRGGAGFPTGMKWSFIDNKNWPHYVVANADESEPGTFKDRELMEIETHSSSWKDWRSPPTLSRPRQPIFICGANFGISVIEMDRQIAELEEAGLLGEGLFGTDYHLQDVHSFGGRSLYLRRGDCLA